MFPIASNKNSTQLPSAPNDNNFSQLSSTPTSSNANVKRTGSRRKYVKAACQLCKKSKVKCSGDYPCERCLKQKQENECVYKPQKKRGPRSRSSSRDNRHRRQDDLRSSPISRSRSSSCDNRSRASGYSEVTEAEDNYNALGIFPQASGYSEVTETEDNYNAFGIFPQNDLQQNLPPNNFRDNYLHPLYNEETGYLSLESVQYDINLDANSYTEIPILFTSPFLQTPQDFNIPHSPLNIPNSPLSDLATDFFNFRLDSEDNISHSPSDCYFAPESLEEHGTQNYNPNTFSS
ncbi:24657_t:CDS:1 [Dentiscutata erythropus]|uniref:24657_t:CDS:1 n=1 Tax=Dentiscutata erythropus TaxID=1348616 RepID=A0A9N9FGY0_9GLOM|nr:24657_t:CDS:1 [Dentiscutata erythropus]